MYIFLYWKGSLEQIEVKDFAQGLTSKITLSSGIWTDDLRMTDAAFWLSSTSPLGNKSGIKKPLRRYSGSLIYSNHLFKHSDSFIALKIMWFLREPSTPCCVPTPSGFFHTADIFPEPPIHYTTAKASIIIILSDVIIYLLYCIFTLVKCLLGTFLLYIAKCIYAS